MSNLSSGNSRYRDAAEEFFILSCSLNLEKKIVNKKVSNSINWNVTSDYEQDSFKIPVFNTRIEMCKRNNFLADFGNGANVLRVFASSMKTLVS